MVPPKLIPISEIVEEKSVYPRSIFNWKQSLTYAHAMKAGAVFPPITVAKIDGKTILIDGLHRLKAMKKNKQDYIQADFIDIKDMEEAYIEAVKRNISHGQGLSIYEKLLAFKRLKESGFAIEKISAILYIPQANLIKYSTQRITMTTSGEEIVLKAPLQNLSEMTDVNISFDEQRIFSADGQLRIINEMISLLKNGWIDKKNKSVEKALNILKSLLV